MQPKEETVGFCLFGCPPGVPIVARLQGETGIDVQAKQTGGIFLCFSEAELEARRERLAAVRDEVGGEYPYEILDRATLLQRLPHVGPKVVGASYSPMDGHVNPLKLLRALHTACIQRGVMLKTGHGVERITHADGLFTAHIRGQQFRAPKLVLAAGLGNASLAGQVGLHAPVRPNRGQLIVTERTEKLFDYPTGHIRQTDEGGIQIGESMEDAGFDDSTTTSTLADLARRAVASFPMLGQLNVIRVWGALRVMTPDGYPIYQESKSCPGAYVVTCHSGVTLAAAHAFRIAPWINGAAPRSWTPFGAIAFAPQTTPHSPWITTMPTEPLFRPISAATERFIDVEFDGRRLAVLGQRSVAAALLAADVSRFRSTPVSGAPRAPYCMMGVCFECLLEINGVANRQACLVPVQPGMKIRSQEGARSWEAIHTASGGSNENGTEDSHAA